MADAPRSPRRFTVTSVSLIAGGALLVGLLAGLLLPAAAPTLAGLGESCAGIHNEVHEIRVALNRPTQSEEVSDETRELADAQLELLERRPDCFGDHDRDTIEGFIEFLDQDG